MSVLARIHNRLLVRGFLINSLPKSGTNLLIKAATLFPGIRSLALHLSPDRVASWKRPEDEGAATVPIGVSWPRPMPLPAVRRALEQIGNGHFASTHVSFSQPLADLLVRMGLKSLLILRDPRDVVVSLANYIARTPVHPLYPHYQPLSEPKRVMLSICGIPAVERDQPMLLDIGESCRNVLPWMSQPLNYTTTFEKIVGPRGGGSREAQRKELANIARHLGIRHRRHDLDAIAEQVFGGTATFLKGSISTWPSHFSAEHKAAFKQVAGQVLVDMRYEKNCDW